MSFWNDISPIHASIVAVLSPLLASVYQAIVGKRDQRGYVALIAILISTVSSGAFVFAEIWENQVLHQSVEWFTVGDRTFSIGVLLNNLTVLMQFLVCIIALPVHFYSRAYMKGDPGIDRYWMYLSLFCFAMLGLTISDNLLQMYVFWELVGFASYLLIGFWFTKDSAAQANKKAFIINRIGDLGFLIGIGIIYSKFGTVNLLDLFGESSPALATIALAQHESWLTWAGIAFFVGAMAKSAQFPLHIWLPDAMEGPTSVSSLIHAATMVAAGVFLMATLFPLFNATVLLVVAIIGTVTALAAAIFALSQYDIKKVLAFSTISQLGFMMVGIGIGAWDAAIFHLVTHAFFKCLLFLCAGAVIHEMSNIKKWSFPDMDPQDMRNMGGLRKYMPKTFILMTIASLALAGFPLTSGFLSKDAIVVTAFEWALSENTLYLVIPVVLIVVSILTAFYIGRLIFKTFFGTLRIGELQQNLLHEAPAMMLFPMLFLGICSFAFVFAIQPFSYHGAWLMEGLVAEQLPVVASLHLVVPVVLTTTSLISWLIGWRWYVQEKYPLNANSGWILFSFRQGYLNELNDKLFGVGIISISTAVHRFDNNVVDGVVNGIASAAQKGAKIIAWIDTHVVDGVVRGVVYVNDLVSKLMSWIDRYIVDGFVNVVADTTYYLGHMLRWVQNGRLQNYFGFVFTMILFGILYLVFR